MTTKLTLKWTEPGALVARLEAGGVAGLLVGEQLEADRDLRFVVIDRADGSRAWGVVRALAGVPFPSGAEAVARLADRLDPAVAKALEGDPSPRWFHALRLVERYDPPRALGTDRALKISSPDLISPVIGKKNQEVPPAEVDLEKRLTLWGSPAGKVKIAERLAALLPDGSTYCEPFVGSGAVFFSTERHKREIIGDANGAIVKALRIVQGLTASQVARLRELPAVGDLDTFRKLRDSAEPADPVNWLHRFAYTNRFSIGYKGRDFNGPHSGVRMRLLERLEAARDRLAKVEIVGGDYAATIRKADGPGAVFYLDPPYAGHDVNVGERAFDEDRFLEVLEGIEGKWLLTYGIRGKVGAVLRRKGYTVARVATLRTWGNARAGDGVMKLEQIVAANYEIDESKIRALVAKADEELDLAVVLDEEPEELEQLAGDAEAVAKRAEVAEGLRPLWKSPGGKSSIAPILARMLPPHRTYCEPFAGSGAVLLRKPPAEVEVVNDLDPDISGAFAAVKSLDDAAIVRLKRRDWTSRKGQYARLKAARPRNGEEALYRHLYLTRFSFAGTRAAWDGRLEGQTAKVADRIQAVRDRLAKVRVYRKDYREIVKKFDAADTCFFFDPPYPGSYGLARTAQETGAATGEKHFDEQAFGDTLEAIRGRWILTYGEGGDLPARFRKAGFRCRKIITAARLRTMRAVAEKGETLTHLVFSDKRTSARKAAPEAEDALDPAVLGRLAVPDLIALLRVLDGELASIGDRSKAEDVINAAIFVLEELGRRGAEAPALEVVGAAREFLAGAKRAADASAVPPATERELAPTAPSGTESGREVELDEVLEAFGRSALLRRPAVALVGGLVTQGRTKNDLDIVIRGPLDDRLRRVIQFRIGRMLGAVDPELSTRIQWHDDELGGPITDYVELFDLALVARSERPVVRMAEVAKGDDPLLDALEADGPAPGVLQLHFRGASVHADLRLRVGDHLIGWTLTIQRAGAVKPVDTLEAARAYVDELGLEGSRAFKPIMAPAHVLAVPKVRQPTEWLEIDERVIKPGEVGATPEESGVVVKADRFTWEPGRQEPYFHEYFLTGGRIMRGILYLRQIAGGGGPASEQDAGRVTPAGGTFWTAHVSKSALPSILDRRAVVRAEMPPPGKSWIPRSLEQATPARWRYWEEKDPEKARAMRDDLVASRWFTDGNVRIVDGQFRRVVAKLEVDLDGRGPVALLEPAASLEPVTLAAPVPFVLAWQSFKGQHVRRFGPTRQAWWVIWQDGNGANALELDHDPTAEGASITAQVRRFDDRQILELEGEVAPGTVVGGVELNATKNTRGDWRIVDRGRLAVLEEGPGRFVLSIRGSDLRGVFTAEAEEPGAPVWIWTTGEEPAKKIRTVDGVQVWDPDAKDPEVDRAQLRPLALFSPMKPREGAGEFRQLEELTDKFATPAILEAGLAVEPKYNGRVVVLESDGARPFLFFEDSRRDRVQWFPALRESLETFARPAILVGEFLEVEGADEVPLPRRELARFGRDVEQDDRAVRVMVWDVLYLGETNLAARPYSERIKIRDRLFGASGKVGPWRNVPRRIVHTLAELRAAVAWAGKVPGSEGAMVKRLDGTYTLGGHTDSDVKLKLQREIVAIVTDRTLKDPAPNQEAPAETWIYTCAIGPVDNPEEWRSTVEIGGRPYIPIGRTFATNVKATVGDRLRVEVTELLLDTRNRKAVTWFTPSVVEATDSKPTTIAEIERMLQPTEIAKLADRPFGNPVPLFKADGTESRFVLGIVLEPNDGKGGAPLDPDAQHDVYSEDDIRAAAWEFLAKYRRIGFMHEKPLAEQEIEIVESYVAPAPFTLAGYDVRRGTWLLGARVISDELWQRIKRGELAAWSVDGVASRKPLEGSN